MSDESPAYLNPDLPEEQRIDDLLSRMTLDEKIACLSTDPSVLRLGLPGSRHVEGLHGLALGGPANWGKDATTTTTSFPQAIGLAESWDPELVRRVANAEAREARFAFHRLGRGGLVIRAPNADLGRDPRWGRTEECFGEDAYFNGVMSAAFVRGLQGDHPRYFQAASLLKHFLANSNENERLSSSSDFDERLFHEYYAAPFRAAIVEAGARAFMAAYNRYNGVPCTTHPMLREITVEKWHQDGIICTDGGAFRQLVTGHRYYGNFVEAAVAVIRAGVSQFLDDFGPSVEKALALGLLDEAEIERAIRPNFRVMIRLGLWDPPELVPYTETGSAAPWNGAEHRELAFRATVRSIVLLENDGLLPLDAGKLRSVAVLGRHADRVLLDWYSGTPPYTVSALAGIRERLGGGVCFEHASGEDAEAAARLAASADVAIVIAGNHPTGNFGWAEVERASDGKEAFDRRSLELEDEALIKKVYAANPRSVVVLISSFPYAVEWTKRHVPALVHLTHGSQELGTALAAVLFGDENPGGRLVQTWPRSIDDLPPMLDYDIRRGRTYMYFEGEPLYAFGYGLSYTSFEYRRLATSAERVPRDGSLEVSVELENTGLRAGDEVVQMYVRHLGSAVPRPRLELKGFRRVTLGAGERRVVTLALAAESLGYWNTGNGAFEVESGEIEIAIGRSARQIELTRRVAVV
jgi:beta-glucosidase